MSTLTHLLYILPIGWMLTTSHIHRILKDDSIYTIGITVTELQTCPGLGQDRVNFHWTPGRGTAGRADPTWPNRAGNSIPCAVILGSGGGELGNRNSLAAREGTAEVLFGKESGCVLWALFCWFVLCIPLFCIVVVPVPFVCCSVKLPLS